VIFEDSLSVLDAIYAFLPCASKAIILVESTRFMNAFSAGTKSLTTFACSFVLNAYLCVYTLNILGNFTECALLSGASNVSPSLLLRYRFFGFLASFLDALEYLAARPVHPLKPVLTKLVLVILVLYRWK
jgi:hypothetical protein